MDEGRQSAAVVADALTQFRKARTAFATVCADFCSRGAGGIDALLEAGALEALIAPPLQDPVTSVRASALRTLAAMANHSHELAADAFPTGVAHKVSASDAVPNAAGCVPPRPSALDDDDATGLLLTRPRPHAHARLLPARANARTPPSISATRVGRACSCADAHRAGAPARGRPLGGPGCAHRARVGGKLRFGRYRWRDVRI